MKAVVFDFDGTLTKKNGNLWRKMWSKLGYEIGEGSYYKTLLNSFLEGSLSYEKWCELILEAFKKKNFKKHLLDEFIDESKCMHGLESLFKTLKEKNVEIHIVSGNIIYVIKQVLGSSLKYVTNVVANELKFDNKGFLVDIVSTKYDCDGKAKYIEELCEKKKFNKNEVVFVGNSLNDEWVYKSGVKTVCINPNGTKSDNSEVWNNVIFTDNLMDLMGVFYE